MSAKLTVLGSNSSGNGYLLQVGKEVLILEAGVPVKDALKALDYDITNAKAVIVTHHHLDHLGYCKQYQRYFKVYSTPAAAEATAGVIPLSKNTKYMIGGFTILPLPVPHNVECYAYVIDHPNMGRLVFATDLCEFPYKIPKVNFAMMEVNFCNEVVLDRICSNGDIRSHAENHMSLDAAIEAIKRLRNPSLQSVIGIHLSDGNSSEEIIKNRFYSELGIKIDLAEKKSVFILSLEDF